MHVPYIQLFSRQEADLAGAMRELDAQKGSEHGINVLMRRHTLEREACEERWSNELTQLRDSQRREYRDWVTKVYEDMQSQNSRGKREEGVRGWGGEGGGRGRNGRRGRNGGRGREGGVRRREGG